MSKIIANIIGRNEAPHYLDSVLARVSKQVDEIVFTDDASDDNTVEIVQKYTDKINQLKEPMFSTHEGRLRQASWDFLEQSCEPSQDDWILAIDCDEKLYTETSLHELVAQHPNRSIMNIWFYHMWNETEYRTDGGWRPHGSTRFFKYVPGGKFRDAALACGSEPTYVLFTARNYPKSFLRDSGLRMKHLSYIKDEDKQAKYERYNSIDGGKFHANAHIQSIIDPPEKVRLEKWK